MRDSIKVILLSVAFFSFAFIESVLYYKEKVIFDDPSSLFFFLTAHGDHFILHYRYGGWLIFLFPALGKWLG
ncbi:MAG: hypothetical protein RMK98_08100 [Bacteroidia bacterium]|nr:hypothetical protein [Bacteroidia bacterium]